MAGVPAWAISWAPSGDAVLVHRDGFPQILYLDPMRPGHEFDRSGCAKWSPAGSHIALMEYEDDHSELFIYNADGSGERSIFRAEGWHGPCAHWSPAADRLALAFNQSYPSSDTTKYSESTIFTMHPDGTTLRQEFHAYDHDHIRIYAWIEPGIIFSYFHGLIQTHRTYYNMLRLDGSSGTSNYRAVGEYCPANNLMAFSTTSLSEGEGVTQPAPGIYTIGAKTGTLNQVLDYHPCGRPSWSPDCRFLVFECFGSLAVLDLESPAEPGISLSYLETGTRYALPKWSPRGDKIAVWWAPSWDQRSLRFLDVERDGPHVGIATPIQRAGWGAVKENFKTRQYDACVPWRYSYVLFCKQGGAMK